jgi:hypothetical protein
VAQHAEEDIGNVPYVRSQFNETRNTVLRPTRRKLISAVSSIEVYPSGTGYERKSTYYHSLLF